MGDFGILLGATEPRARGTEAWRCPGDSGLPSFKLGFAGSGRVYGFRV